MNNTKHTIYDNYDIYSDEMKAYAKETLEINEVENITEEMISQECEESDRMFFEDERSELKKHNEGELVAIADVGRWNGRFSGYKIVSCIADTLYSNCDYESLYVDSNGDLRKEESHHDGSNFILYRYWKSGLTENQKENFLSKIYNGECTQKDITRYTRKAGLAIAEVYGWKVRGLKKA